MQGKRPEARGVIVFRERVGRMPFRDGGGKTTVPSVPVAWPESTEGFNRRESFKSF